jgi:hypothetical protein
MEENIEADFDGAMWWNFDVDCLRAGSNNDTDIHNSRIDRNPISNSNKYEYIDSLGDIDRLHHSPSNYSHLHADI